MSVTLEQVAQWHDEQGHNGLWYVMQVVSQLLDPRTSEFTAAFVGRLVSTLISKAGRELGENLDQILRAILSKMQQAETLSVMQVGAPAAWLSVATVSADHQRPSATLICSDRALFVFLCLDCPAPLALVSSGHETAGHETGLPEVRVLPVAAVTDHGVRAPGAHAAGTTPGVSVQPPRPHRQACPGVRDGGVDEPAAPVLWAVRGKSQVWLPTPFFCPNLHSSSIVPHCLCSKVEFLCVSFCLYFLFQFYLGGGLFQMVFLTKLQGPYSIQGLNLDWRHVR